MGRPKSFCREEVLDLATDIFRRSGFNGTSMQELIDAMGINRFSLYEEFGDKNHLFIEAFDRYVEMRRQQLVSILAEPGPRKPLIRKYFESVVADALSYPAAGCLLLSSAVELVQEQPLIADRLRQQFTVMEDTLYQALVEARQNGEISPKLELRALARFLVSNVRGIRLTARVAPSEGVLMDIVDVVVSILDQ